MGSLSVERARQLLGADINGARPGGRPREPQRPHASAHASPLAVAAAGSPRTPTVPARRLPPDRISAVLLFLLGIGLLS